MKLHRGAAAARRPRPSRFRPGSNGSAAALDRPRRWPRTPQRRRRRALAATSPKATAPRARCRAASTGPRSGSPPPPTRFARPGRRPAPLLAADLRLRLLRPLRARRRARRSERRRAGQVIDLDHGGQAAQMLVIPRYTFNTPGSEALNDRLKEDAAALAASLGLADRRHRRRRPAHRLQRRDLLARAAGDRRDHPRHLPRPRPRPARAAAGGARGRAQPAHRRGRLRRPRRCSSTSPPAGRSAATPTSTRSAPPASSGSSSGSRSTTRSSC